MRKLLILAPLSLCVLGSCKDDEIRTYKVATEATSDTSAPVVDPIGAAPKEEAPHDHAAHSGAVTWQAPADWKQEEAGQFLTAAYAVPGGGRVTVSKLGGDGGGLAANINRWRGQAGLPPLPDDQVAGQPMKIADSEEEMLLYNLAPENLGEDKDGILAAVLPLESETWYFKFTASKEALGKSGGPFTDFLRTIRVAGDPATPAAQPSAPEGAKDIKLTPPEGWTPSEGSAMRAASFGIVGPDEATADVSVVPLPGDSGSVLDNVNRWRSQLQLGPIDSEDDPALGEKSESPAGEIFLSHMVSTEPVLDGKKAAIGSAILKRPGMTWFFKITGEAALVEANREKFEAFVRSATFP